jgi:hypothetical protein
MMPSLDCISSAQERDVSAERALERVFSQYFELKPGDLSFTGTSPALVRSNVEMVSKAASRA